MNFRRPKYEQLRSVRTSTRLPGPLFLNFESSRNTKQSSRFRVSRVSSSLAAAHPLVSAKASELPGALRTSCGKSYPYLGLTHEYCNTAGAVPVLPFSLWYVWCTCPDGKPYEAHCQPGPAALPATGRPGPPPPPARFCCCGTVRAKWTCSLFRVWWYGTPIFDSDGPRMVAHQPNMATTILGKAVARDGLCSLPKAASRAPCGRAQGTTFEAPGRCRQQIRPTFTHSSTPKPAGASLPPPSTGSGAVPGAVARAPSAPQARPVAGPGGGAASAQTAPGSQAQPPP